MSCRLLEIVTLTSALLSLSVSGCGDSDAPPAPTPTPDAPELTLSPNPSALQLAEGGAEAQLQIGLSAPAIDPIEVSISASPSDKVSVSPATVRFAAGASDPVSVAFTAAQDDDVADDVISISISSSLGNQTFNVTIEDDDGLEIVAGAGPFVVLEGGALEIPVRLSLEPEDPVALSVTSDNPALAVLTPSLVFASTNWNLDQSIRVQAASDANTANGAAQITIAAAGLESVTLPITLEDPDELTFETSFPSLTIDEGSSGTIGVSLSAEPSDEVEVSVDIDPADIAEATPTRLTFTAANWDRPQVVTIASEQDADTTREVGSIQLRASGVAGLDVVLTVNDDDSLDGQRVEFTNVPADGIVLNEGEDAQFGMALRFQPNADVNVGIASLNPAVAVDPQFVTFTAESFDVAQTITVSAVDDLNVTSESVILTISSASTPDQTIAVAVTDDDAQSIVVNPNALVIDEGASGTFTVNLAFEPSQPVTLSFASAGNVSISPTSFTFDAGNFAAPQTITVNALEDANIANETAQISIEGPGITAAQVGLTLNDNDSQAIVTSAPALTLTEGADDDLGVRLAFQPSGSVTVNIASSAAEATVAPASLTFTAQTWDVEQIVTVTAVEDPDVSDETLVLTLSSAGLANVTVATTITDNDSLNLSATPSSLSLTEGAAGASFNVVLTQQPASTVTVDLAISDSTKASLSRTSLTFTNANWDTAQSVTVTPLDDDDAVAEAVTVTVTSLGLTTQTINVTVAEDDVLDLQLSRTTLAVDEGDFGEFTAVLTAQPQSNVVVNVSVSDARLGTLSPTQLTFTASNWSTAQTVRLTTVQDLDASDESGSITLSASAFASQSVAVDVTDDETQEVILSTASLAVDEGGASGTFEVRLSALPLNPVTVVTLTIGDTTRVSLDTTNLVFTPSNFNQTQTIRVTALNDDDLADETVLVNAQVGSEMSGVSVLIADDDVQVVTVTPMAPSTLPSGNLDEGASNSTWMTVRLAFRPASNAVISATGNDASIATIPSVSIAPSDFAASTPVTINGTSNVNLLDNQTTFRLEHLDENGTTHSEGDYTVVVDNVDVPTIVATPASIVVAEGDTSSNIRVTLSNEPSSPVTVTITPPGAATVAPTSVTLDGATWNIGETFTVTGVQDADVRDETGLQITLTSADWATDAIDLTVTDDDSMALEVFEDAAGTIPADGIAIAEDDAAANLLWARLSNEPDASTTVTIATSDDLTATAALTFGVANYGVLQAVEVTPLDDDDVADDTGANAQALTFSHDGSVHALTAVSVAVDVTDDDEQRILQWNDAAGTITYPDPAITMNENDIATQSFWVSLEHEPADNVTFDVTSSDPAVLTVSPATLTFTSLNWGTPQEVILTTVDEDPDNLEDPAAPDVTLTRTSVQAGDEIPSNEPLITSIAVTDDDEQSIVVERLPEGIDETSIQEQGPEGMFQVSLEFPPRGASDVVDITDGTNRLSFSDDGLLFGGALALTFTDASFSVPQRVYVSDAADDGNVTTDTVSVALEIAGEAEADRRHDVVVVDDEIEVIGQATYAQLSGGTRGVERQNIQWGGTRLAFIGYDASLSETTIVTIDRALSATSQNTLRSTAMHTLAATSIRSNVIEVDPTRSEFGFFLAENGISVDYVRTEEDATSLLTNRPLSLIGHASEFSAAWSSTDEEYGFVYRDSLGDDLQFYTVTATAGAQANSRRLTSGTGVSNPNLHWIADEEKFLMLYQRNNDVRCKTFERDPTSSAGVDTTLAGFPAGGALVASVYDGTDVVAAYYDATTLKVVRIDPAACTAGAHVTLRSSPIVTYGTATDPAPMIAFNGQEYAIAYDYVVGQDQKVGLIVDDQLDDTTVSGDFYRTGTPAAAIDGLYPSVTWAGDRWALRYYDAAAGSVEIRTGAFK